MNGSGQSRSRAMQAAASLTQTRRVLVHGVALIVILIPLFALGLSNHGLWRPDEPRVAEIGREMWLTGNWAIPTLDRRPFLEKPPLYFWSLAGVFSLFGRASDGIARIPSAVFGMGGAVAVFFLATMLFGPKVGFFSSLILSTTYDYFSVTHRVLTDSALACFVMAAMTFFMAAYLSEKNRRKFIFYALFYFSSGLAFLSKGFIGLVFPGVGVLAFLAVERNLKELWKMRLWLGVVIVGGMILAWFLALWRQGGGEYLEVFLVQNNLGRFLPGGLADHSQPFYYYLTDLPGEFLPWSLPFVPVLYRLFRRTRGFSVTSRRGLLFSACWFFSGFLVLSLAANKRGMYLLPIAAPFAILTAWWVEETLASMPIWMERAFLWAFALTLLGAGLAVAPLYSHLSGRFALVPLVFSALIVGSSVGSLKFLRRREPARFWAGAFGAVFFVLLFVLVEIVPVMDQKESFVRFTQRLREVVGPDRALYAYRPDESFRGAVPFYTGRYMEEIYERRALEGILDRRDQIFIVSEALRGHRGRERGPGRELLSMGEAGLLVRQVVGKKRIYMLFTNRPGATVRRKAGSSFRAIDVGRTRPPAAPTWPVEPKPATPTFEGS